MFCIQMLIGMIDGSAQIGKKLFSTFTVSCLAVNNSNLTCPVVLMINERDSYGHTINLIVRKM